MTDTRSRTTNGLRLPVYLDNQATTPVDPRVMTVMVPYFTEKFGNPHSTSHAYGRGAEAAVERARGQIAALIGARPNEIIFTSGATESNNLAIKGAAYFHRARKRHIVTVATEHKCVLESCRDLEQEGFEVTYLPVPESGLIGADDVAAALRDDTALVSVMAAHNEIGVLQPVADIGRACRARGVLFHSDCAQAAVKIPLDVDAMSIDLMSLSGHKIYGPMGVGALYVRRRPRARLKPLFSGGGQERGLRSGTLPTPLCVGLGEACAVATAAMASESARIAGLSQRLLAGLTARIAGVVLNGDADQRLPGNLNLSFEGIDADALMAAAEADLALSSGSACTSAAVEPSYVIRALGLGEQRATTSIRFGLGRFTTEAEIDFTIDALAGHVAALRTLRPRMELV